MSLTRRAARSERDWLWGQVEFYAHDAIKRTVETRTRWCIGCKRWAPKCEHQQVSIDLAWARSVAALFRVFASPEEASDGH